MSKKSNIYLFNSLKSVEVKFNKDESLIISKLLDLNNRYSHDLTTHQNLSRELLTIFDIGDMAMWSQVDRVCISLRDSFSNQIFVSSSDQNENVLENVLVSGYYCVVDETSSLISLKDGEIRTYDDIEKIITSFNQSEHKVQRSIGHIHKSKIKSGLTIPLVRNEKIFGFLFLNSTKLNAFKNISSEDYSILCLVKLVAQNLISTTPLETKIFEALSNIQNKNKIQLNQLKHDLEKVLKKYFQRKIVVSVDSQISLDFLLPHRKYVNAIFVCLSSIENFNNFDKFSLTLISTQDTELLSELSFNSSDDELVVRLPNNENKVLGLKIKGEAHKINFSLQFEPMIDNLLYSVD